MHILFNNESLLEKSSVFLENRILGTDFPLEIDNSRIHNQVELFKRVSHQNQYISKSLLSSIRGNSGNFGFSVNHHCSLHYTDSSLLLSEAIRSKKYDFIAHLLQPRYRSHYCHSFFVGVLGWWMLENVYCGSKLLKDVYNEFIEDHYNGDAYDLWDIWWLVALLHDIGYPFSLIWKRLPLLISLNSQYPISSILNDGKYSNPFDQIIDILTEHFNSPYVESFKELLKFGIEQQIELLDSNVENGHVKFQQEFLKCIHEYFIHIHNSKFLPVRNTGRDSDQLPLKHVLEELYLSKKSSRCDIKSLFDNKPIDHGIASVIFSNAFHKKNGNNELSNDKLSQLIFTPIAFHNLEIKDEALNKQDYYDSRYDFDILFLRLVDQLQEWGRGILIEKTNEILIESKCIKIGSIFPESDKIDIKEGLEITYMFDDENFVFSKAGWDFEKIREDKKKAFRKLRIDGKEINIRVRMELLSEFNCG